MAANKHEHLLPLNIENVAPDILVIKLGKWMC